MLSLPISASGSMSGVMSSSAMDLCVCDLAGVMLSLALSCDRTPCLIDSGLIVSELISDRTPCLIVSELISDSWQVMQLKGAAWCFL